MLCSDKQKVMSHFSAHFLGDDLAKHKKALRLSVLSFREQSQLINKFVRSQVNKDDMCFPCL